MINWFLLGNKRWTDVIFWWCIAASYFFMGCILFMMRDNGSTTDVGEGLIAAALVLASIFALLVPHWTLRSRLGIVLWFYGLFSLPIPETLEVLRRAVSDYRRIKK